MVQLTKNLPQLIQVVVKTHNDLQLLLVFSKGSFFSFQKAKMTVENLLSFYITEKVVCFGKTI